MVFFDELGGVPGTVNLVQMSMTDFDAANSHTFAPSSPHSKSSKLSTNEDIDI